jgi:hypothetical protein
MIHATIPGVLITDATYVPAARDHERANEASAFFQIASRRGGNQTQLVECTFRGRGAAVHHQHLLTGKRVIVTGALHLATSGGRPRLVLSVHNLELVGGPPRPSRLEDDEDADDAV